MPSPLEQTSDAARESLFRAASPFLHQRNLIRQGEWFFVPEPELHVDARLILRNEPIRRGGGKPHLVAELYRSGGEDVWVCSRFPNGLTESDYKQTLARNREAKRWGWRRMRRNAGVFARGTVRHRDHATMRPSRCTIGIRSG